VLILALALAGLGLVLLRPRATSEAS